ncbi:hypothetical protein [Roseimarinus sediminis]|uniref:hypothetical protein n=1 Tax=Roseimarinus sediminis TaxID=1610899 RepID=UPI003D1A019A
MKYINILFCVLLAGVALTFSSCEDNFEVTSTHTDASTQVGGTYTGTFSLDDRTYTDAVVTLTRIEADSVQAVTANVKVPSLKGLDVTASLNAGTANDEFVFSSGVSVTSKMSGRLSDGTLNLNVPLSRSETVLSNASTAKVWQFTGTRN